MSKEKWQAMCQSVRDGWQRTKEKLAPVFGPIGRFFVWNREHYLAHLTGVVSRLLLGLTFLFSGFVKAVDPLGTTYKIEDYLKAFSESWAFFKTLLPLAETAAIVLITVELVLGVCLLMNIRSRWTSWLTLLFYCAMTPLALYIALKNPVSDCGCFGDALVLTNWQTFWKNVVLISLAVLFVATAKRMKGFFRWQTELGIVVFALCCTGALQAYCLTHLPIFDFRPYKVGTNILEAMEIPDWAEPSEYETTFIYEKNGKQKEFTTKDYLQAKADGWTFVDQKSRLVKQGYEAPIHDFVLFSYYDETMERQVEEPTTTVDEDGDYTSDDFYAQFGIYDDDEALDADEYDTDEEDYDIDEDYASDEDMLYADEYYDDGDEYYADADDYEVEGSRDITMEVLNGERVMLIVMYDLHKVDAKQVEKLALLQERAARTGESFYIVTGSTGEDIRKFCELYKASGADWANDPESCFATADGVMLKTVVRANPGLVILRSGTIARKYNIRNLSKDDINNKVIL